jgi:uncharacterized membrane protein YfcA
MYLIIYMINNGKIIFLTILLGLISGLIGGGLGIDGYIIALPCFLLLGLVPHTKTSIGTMLVSAPASWPTVYRYYKSGNVDLAKGMIYFIFYFIGSYLGGSLNLLLSEMTLNYSVSILHFLIGSYFLYRALI